MKIKCWDHSLQAIGQVAVLLGLVFLTPVAASAAPASPAQSGRFQKLASPEAVPDGLSAPEWSSIRQQYEQHLHAVLPIPNRDGYQARNPGQQWQTRFDGRGFIVQPEPRSSRREEAHSKKSETRNAKSEIDQSLLMSAATESLATGIWQWGLELKSYGFAGHERAVAGQPRVTTTGQRVTYDWDATLQEWFVNDRRGLEHGFTVRERPYQPSANDREVLECASPLALWNLGAEFGSALGLAVGIGRADEKRQRAGALQDAVAPSLSSQLSTLNFLLAVRGGLRPEVQADGRGVRFVDAQGAAALTYSELTVLDADGRKLPARFEPVKAERGVHAASTPAREATLKRSEDRAPQTDTALLRLVIDERGARYPLTIDPIAQQAYLKASNSHGAFMHELTGRSFGDTFGASVAVSGDTVVVGAWGESSNATGVNGDQSDTSADEAGAAYVFVRNGTTWTQQAYLKASNAGYYDVFGYSVAVSGDTVVVGAPGEGSSARGVNGNQGNNSADSSGAAYVFVRSGTTWTQQAYLKASNTGTGDSFGLSVAVSGNTILVGAHSEASSATGVNGNQSDNSVGYSGAAYVFVRSGTTWTQQAYLKASNTMADANFGYSVAVSGDTLVVGAWQEDNSAGSSGAAYVFVRNGTTWTQQAYLKASNTDADDSFGVSVAVSGDTVVVGAVWESSNATGVDGDQSDNSARHAGAAYVFVRSGTTWTQQAYLKASNTEAYDQFGSSVAVSGDTVVVGAYGESSNATGVDSNQGNNSATNSGAAYVFVRNGTTWTQQAYLKASNSGGLDYPYSFHGPNGDSFGHAVAVSGDTVVAGAPYEDSNATGVNGNQSDNSAESSGAAYIFTDVGIGPRLAFAQDGSGSYFLRFTGAPDVTYRLQRAPSVTGPWSALVTNTASASGLIEYHETSPPPGTAFYRTAQP